MEAKRFNENKDVLHTPYDYTSIVLHQVLNEAKERHTENIGAIKRNVTITNKSKTIRNYTYMYTLFILELCQFVLIV